MKGPKEHHYAPKFHLKHFSTNPERNEIGIYNLSNKMFFYRAPIKSQAKEKLFYGDDDKIESMLSKLEYAVSIIMVKLINQQIVPEIQTTDYLRLLHFV